MLRKQSAGKQKLWTEDQLKSGFQKFFQIHKKYPTAEEVNKFQYLPSARSIQRTSGGLINLRKKLGLKSQKDFRSGAHSSKRAKDINKRNQRAKIELYALLSKLVDPELIQKDYSPTDDGRIYTDFYIKNRFAIDIINPSNRQSLVGCLSAKIKSLKKREPKIPTVILVNNRDISQGEIQKILDNKTNKLPGHTRVESINNLEEALKNK